MEFEAHVAWQRGAQPFTDQKYNRAHEWAFDGGLRVPASSSPHSVPVPLSDPGAVDPEEALTAAAASCYMLFYLSFAAARGFVIDSYEDHPLAVMGKNDLGRVGITRITLRPAIRYSGDKLPTQAELDEISHLSHQKCYIANSLRAEVVIEPRQV